MNQSVFANAIDIRHWLESDARTPERERVARDRRIGKALSHTRTTARFTRVLAWWDAMQAQATISDTINLPGQRLAAMVNLATAILLLLGLLLGVSVAGLAFGYQGKFPVNLFALLGILVGLPLAMLIGSLLLLKVKVLLPASLHDAVAILNPGRWVGSWLEKSIPVGLFESISSRSVRGNFARWQLLAFSQTFAIGYFVGVLTVAWLLIVFTDMAFGWSTTLNIHIDTVWRGFQVVCSPWSAWLPVAVPDQALVEASRFFRLENQGIDAAHAASLGSWWPFVLMFIAVYGLLPRVILALISNWLLYKAKRQLLEAGPEITALLDRLNTPSVTFEGPVTEEIITESASLPVLPGFELDAHTQVIIWNDVLTTSQFGDWVKNQDTNQQTPIIAAEWQPVLEQRQSLQQAKQGISRIVILTKGWEPPLLAFNDYLTLVRESLGVAPAIAVAPLDVTRKGVSHEDRDIWARALAGHHDPSLYVIGASL